MAISTRKPHTAQARGTCIRHLPQSSSRSSIFLPCMAFVYNFISAYIYFEEMLRSFAHDRLSSTLSQFDVLQCIYIPPNFLLRSINRRHGEEVVVLYDIYKNCQASTQHSAMLTGGARTRILLGHDYSDRDHCITRAGRIYHKIRYIDVCSYVLPASHHTR